jgi:hypothetical protein
VFQPTPRGLDVTVKQNIVDETTEMGRRFLRMNYITHKDLRMHIGKAMHIASLVPTVRPFLNELYAALHDKTRQGPMDQCIWARQVSHSVSWLQALLMRNQGQLKRSFDVDVYFGRGAHVDMCLDASPWGLGGFLTENGTITSWFACAISNEEAGILGITVGSSTCQQIVEALVVLVALRAWSHRWSGQRAQVRLRSDSISALILALKLKTKGDGTSIVAREVALDIADALYAPNAVEHVPGVENVTADMLSRKYAPAKESTYALPQCLEGVEELVLPTRGRSYFQTITQPSDSASQKWAKQRDSYSQNNAAKRGRSGNASSSAR